MGKQKSSFLGQGWAFIPEISESNGETMMVSKEKDIKESLFILFSTSPGERIMHPEYGCNLNKFVFEPITNTLYNRIKDAITHAILLFEPRIKLMDIKIKTDDAQENKLEIAVEYTIIQTNSRQNMVYPMYLREGTNIKTID